MLDAMSNMTNDHLSQQILKLELVVTRLSAWMALPYMPLIGC